jgi:hypothetical protein
LALINAFWVLDAFADEMQLRTPEEQNAKWV